MVKRPAILILAATVPFLLTACGKEEKPFVPIHRAKPPAVTQAAGQEDQQMELHELKPGSTERNPFVSHIMLARDSGTVKKIKGPLECCDVQQFKLMAVVVAAGHSSALLQAPDGKRYIVKKGDFLGSQEGRIIKIGERSLTVRENTLDESGRIMSYNDQELVLPAKSEDSHPTR